MHGTRNRGPKGEWRWQPLPGLVEGCVTRYGSERACGARQRQVGTGCPGLADVAGPKNAYGGRDRARPTAGGVSRQARSEAHWARQGHAKRGRDCLRQGLGRVRRAGPSGERGAGRGVRIRGDAEGAVSGTARKGVTRGAGMVGRRERTRMVRNGRGTLGISWRKLAGLAGGGGQPAGDRSPGGPSRVTQGAAEVRRVPGVRCG